MNIDSEEFLKIISEIDGELEQDGMHIPRRPQNATFNIFVRFEESGPLYNPWDKSCAYPVTANNLTHHVHKWYQEKYGDLLKVDFSPGAFPFEILGHIYRCKLPLLIGSFHVVGSKGYFKGRNIINAVDFLEDLPDYVRQRMDQFLPSHIQNMFFICMEVSKELSLRRFREMGLVKSARSDADISCELLLGSTPNAGLSAWHSLQFAEKIMKSMISLHEKPRFTHNIEELKNRAITLGYKPDPRIRWDIFNYTASVRYEPNSITKNHALEANHESWRVGFNVLKQL